MITLKKLAVYKKYEGDLDLCIRNNNKKDIGIIGDDDWYLISRLLSDIVLIKNNLTSDEFRRKTIQLVHDCTENEEVIELLREESKKGISVSNKVKNGFDIFDFLPMGIVKWIIGFLFIRIIAYLIFN